MAQQDVRYFLNGTLLSITEERLTVVATDGHRLALTKHVLREKAAQDTIVIVPRKGVVEIQHLLADKTDENVEVIISKNHIRIIMDNFILTSKLINARYPHSQKVIPKLTDSSLLVDRDLLKLALTRVAVLSNEKIRGVRLELTTDKLRLLTNNIAHEQAEDEIAINYAGKAMEISLNISYLLDVLNILDGGSLKIDLRSANEGILIEHPGQQHNSIYVIMPMRL